MTTTTVNVTDFVLDDVLIEYDEWLERRPESPAKRWCLANPPGARHAAMAVVRAAIHLDLAA